MKVVSPYRPFAPESAGHRRLGPFDWPAALAMLQTSVQRACHCETYAVTDLTTPLPIPAHRYQARERRLMLWLLDVCVQYLDSPAFDDDTVLISPDVLVYGDLRPWFLADLGVIVRLEPKYAERPLLNGVQWWARAAQPRLVAFYQRALALARTLPESTLTWGADTVPLVTLLAPLVAGTTSRDGLSVCGIPHTRVFAGINRADLARLAQQRRIARPTAPLVDFKYLRKRAMAGYYAATLGDRP